MLAKSLMAGGIVTGLYLPMLAWLYLRPASLKRYSGFPLEELELNEEDLSEAISNWVYAKQKRRMEGRIQLLEDDAKNVICRVTVRKD